MRVTVIIAFYRNLKFLRLVLAGFARQSMQDFEIVIADDGSGPAVVAEVHAMMASSPHEIRHVWQEDIGFRKNRILNKAVLAAEAEYLVFIDGDCVPHVEFVREHYENRRTKVCLVGRRVDLSARITAKLSDDKIRQGFFENHMAELLFDSLLLQSRNVEKGIYVKSDFLRRIINKKKRDLLGCNFSLHKQDLLSINGFDERYEEPGIGEDYDIQLRLEKNNIALQSVINVTIQYHLYHQKLAISDSNAKLLEQVRASGVYFTPFGIDRKAGLFYSVSL